MRAPADLLPPAGLSPWLANPGFGGPLARQYRGALRDATGAVLWLMVDLARRMGPRRAANLARGREAPGEEDLAYVLLSAERITRMLAHLHIARLLGKQAERWPERRPLAERFMRRSEDVCHLNARQIRRGDTDALDAVRTWHAAAG
jgi:hypothetical protein